MTTLLLVRHGRSTANAEGVLAGRAEGIELDDVGRADAVRIGERLTGVTVHTVVCSPVLRCRQTADALLAAAGLNLPVASDDRLSECDYGEWTGRPLAELAKEPAWSQIQSAPSTVTFPGGERMDALFARVNAAVSDWAVRLQDESPDAVWLVVSHADPIKAILARCLDMPPDAFQRLIVDPGSVSAVQLGGERPLVLAVNSTHRPLATLIPAKGPAEAVVGGGLGTQNPSSGC